MKLLFRREGGSVFEGRGISMVAHLLECNSPVFESGSSPAHGKICHFLGGLSPGRVQYRGPASEGGAEVHKIYIKKPWR